MEEAEYLTTPEEREEYHKRQKPIWSRFWSGEISEAEYVAEINKLSVEYSQGGTCT